MQAKNYFLILRLKSRRQAALGITEASFVDFPLRAVELNLLLSLALSLPIEKLADFFENRKNK